MEDKLVYNGFYGVELIERVVKGQTKTFERLKIRDAVAAVVVDNNDRVALVFQYRPCIGHITVELPAGLMDKLGLTKHQILTEELYEECGIHPSEISKIEDKPFASYLPIVGGSDTRLDIYEVHLNCNGRSLHVEDADVELVEWYTKEEVKLIMSCGSIYDGKTLIGLNHFLYNM